MSAPINDGGPAFHSITVKKGDNYNAATLVHHRGMALRDWFAGQAIIGMLSNVSVDAPNDATLSKFAYSLADAMIAAREVKP
jgi:hypothetical protein